MRGLKKFLRIEDRNYNKLDKEERRDNLRMEEYRSQGLM